MNKKKNKQKEKKTTKMLGEKWLIMVLAVFSIAAFIFFSLMAYLETRDANKIIFGVKIAGIDMSGMTALQANGILQKKSDNILNKGIVLRYGKKKIRIQNSLQSIDDPDINKDLITYDNKQAISQALMFGHSKSPIKNLKDQYNALKNKINISLTANIAEQEIKNIASNELADLIIPAKSAGIKIIEDKYIITPDKSGQNIDWQSLLSNLKNKAKLLIPLTINLVTIQENPQVTKKEAEQNIQKLIKIIKDKPELILNWDENKKIIPWKDLQNWLVWDKNEKQEIVVNLSQNKITQYLEKLKNEINRPALDAKFEIKNGRVVKFQASQDGQELNIQQNISTIRKNFLNKKYQTDLVITPSKAKVETADANDLGIREIIGIGTSNFAGSPRNRRHNIKVGADALNGLLIAPGEEFSLLKALGKINAASGYLPELVIKGNKTVPEYGGGLCQIGTTTFRATLNSGLLITARRNHSYRVSYYEPAGTDATIYDPAPDYKFINDTKNYILIQTRIEGDELIFEFWGTKDGRQINITKPIIYNITPPPATKYIETTDLKPGEKKCTERAHAGADAKFNYTVTYPDGEIKEKTFTSHYRPWGAVCLIGVEEKKDTEAEIPSETTSTPPIKQQ